MKGTTPYQRLSSRRRSSPPAYISPSLSAGAPRIEQQLQETAITDEHIASVTEQLKDAQSLVAEVEGNPHAQRKLIEFLNLRAVLRVDEARERWVDIRFLLEVYPRRVGKQGSGSPLR